MAEVLVLVDHVDGQVKKVTTELLTVARRIGEPAAVWVGDGADAGKATLAEYGAEKVYVAPAELNDYVDAYADKLAAMPVQSLRWSKTTINVPLRQMAASMMDVGMAYENISSQHPDHLEAIAAFREKRKPVFNKK